MYIIRPSRYIQSYPQATPVTSVVFFTLDMPCMPCYYRYITSVIHIHGVTAIR